MLQQIFLRPCTVKGGAYLYPGGLDSCFDISIEITLHCFDTVFKLCTVKGGAHLHPGLDSCFDISIEISLHHFDTVFKLSSPKYVTLRHLYIFSFLS